METLEQFYKWTEETSDPRTRDWLLLQTPWPIICIFVSYLTMIYIGPKLMKGHQAWNLKSVLIPYNFALVILSFYMFYEFLMSAALAGYSLKCQPVDYSRDPLALRMASVCWWFFFSKVIELLDTLFFILRKKENQITFLHVYHHCTMIINWYLGAKYVAGGQAFLLAMINSFVHIWMYSYYTLAAVGPHMQKYLWWKKYMTTLQLTQFFIVVAHTGYNMTIDCNFPQGFNYAVFFYAITLIILFGNFYYKSYVEKKATKKQSQNGTSHSKVSNGYHYELRSRKPESNGTNGHTN
ncbi:unnamed protein product [Owenia fusiformis]|uniref:Elongation of very long chain fatty acids protein n=1 Tax=Owenia fusiformis TaxID=6347 RepID=A0A8J1YAA6_OWEFU|nr:unnamed protein product [Owenia fusiformis]